MASQHYLLQEHHIDEICRLTKCLCLNTAVGLDAEHIADDAATNQMQGIRIPLGGGIHICLRLFADITMLCQI